MALSAVLGTDGAEAVSNARLLVVGAGGIGCELLKNLVLGGFTNIEVIDLDTIDVSNLNRQFLFRKQHVGMSKAEVAAAAARAYNPDATIVAHHNTIYAEQYGVDFFKSFTCVANALDNLKARRHVNRLCLAADIPLVESGTSGYLGQATVIRKGETECFECLPKPTPTTYPVCTIRSTPSASIHCIVWAKNVVFRELFAHPSELADDEDDAAAAGDTDAAIELSKTKTPLRELSAEVLFDRLFDEDIRDLLSMEDLWKDRTPPTAVTRAQLSVEAESEATTPTTTTTTTTTTQLPDQVVWSQAKCMSVFIDSVNRLRGRLGEGVEALAFDKDDEEALNLVTAAACLRARAFGIEPESRFEVKAKAGNIVPAIATTNAVIAGLIVLELYKLVTNKHEKCRTTYLIQRPNARGRLLVASKLYKPSKKCYVCQKAFVGVKLNTNTVTLGVFVNQILIGALGFHDPDVAVGGTIWYESIGAEGEDDDDVAEMAANLKKVLSDIRITDSTIVSVSDYSQNTNCAVTIIHDEEREPESPFEIVGEPPSHGADGDGGESSSDDDDMIVMTDAPSAGSTSSGEKRKRAESDDDDVVEVSEPKPKKQKGNSEKVYKDGIEVIEL